MHAAPVERDGADLGVASFKVVNCGILSEAALADVREATGTHSTIDDRKSSCRRVASDVMEHTVYLLVRRQKVKR